MEFSYIRIAQTVLGSLLIIAYFIPDDKLRKIKWFGAGRVNRQLMLFAGVILFIIGIWGQLPRI